MSDNTTIAAPAAATGGALCVIRISGQQALQVADAVFRGRMPLCRAEGRTLHRGRIEDRSGRFVDDVVASVFRAPNSFTGQDVVEFSCHGSSYIVSEIMRLLLDNGARMARPGEFTSRAFLAGKIDLAQAEAVADMISADSQASLALASTQMRGGYSAHLNALRDKLLQTASLLELELDFSEEDVQFADRGQLSLMLHEMKESIGQLCASFAVGNAIKNGVSVAIAGAPNAGKSTLLNRLLGEQRAMVSDIAGTTRDTIEETVSIDGLTFRFIDTAGLRHTDDKLEQMGIERTMQAVARARIVLHLAEAGTRPEPIQLSEDQTLLRVATKIDLHAGLHHMSDDTIAVSARTGQGMEELLKRLRQCVDTQPVFEGDAVVSNLRHYDALCLAARSLDRAIEGMQSGLSSDLLSEEIRQIIHHIGEITGSVTSDEILQNIFSRFCVGK